MPQPSILFCVICLAGEPHVLGNNWYECQKCKTVHGGDLPDTPEAREAIRAYSAQPGRLFGQLFPWIAQENKPC